jgi:hypothetical protein
MKKTDISFFSGKPNETGQTEETKSVNGQNFSTSVNPEIGGQPGSAVRYDHPSPGTQSQIILLIPGHLWWQAKAGGRWSGWPVRSGLQNFNKSKVKGRSGNV